MFSVEVVAVGCCSVVMSFERGLESLEAERGLRVQLLDDVGS